MEERDWERIERMMAERIRDWAHTDQESGLKLAGTMAEVAIRLAGIEKHTGELATHQATANHRIEKLEHAHIKEQGVHEERQRWLSNEAASQEQRINSVNRRMIWALGAAGVLSGIVFGIMNLLFHGTP